MTVRELEGGSWVDENVLYLDLGIGLISADVIKFHQNGTQGLCVSYYACFNSI